jgi:16S rRNA (guanine527-N7)-methyltransferase
MAVALSDRARNLDGTLASALSMLGLVATPEQLEQGVAYASLLQRWNAVHNLSATRGSSEFLQQHVIDCLAIVGPLARHASGRALRLLDAGTGAGLPAVILAIMRPDWSVTAVDSVGKKIAFLHQAAGELGLTNLHPQHGRLERMRPESGCFDLITSRAFSSLRLFVESTHHLIDQKGIWAAMKGRPSKAELHDLPAECQLFHVEPLQVPGLEAERCLVWIKPVDPAGTH